MRTFAQKPNASQQTAAKSTMAGGAYCEQSREVKSVLHLQRTIGNQGVQRLKQANAEELEVGSTSAEAPCFAHDFSQIAPYSPAGLATPTRPAINKPGKENEQVGGIREEMRSAPISSPVAPSLQFDFARVSVAATPIQCKPTLNSPGDPFEREADEAAEKVMRIVEATPIGSASAAIQGKSARCEGEEEKSIQTKLAPPEVVQPPAQGATTHPVALQGAERWDHEETLFRQSVIFRKSTFAVPQMTAAPRPPITDRLVGQQAKGELLPTVTRQRMEDAFGYDFSRVRVHRDAEAGEINRQLSALAFTHGSHIYFGNGMYDPAGSSGQRLLAHELTHVVQQEHAAPLGTGRAATPTSAPIVQRFAKFGEGTVNQVFNLANTAPFDKNVGQTVAVLNDSRIMKGADVNAALKTPTVVFSVATGGGFDAQVQTSPTNIFGFEETVLAPGPWKVNLSKAAVRARWPSLNTCSGAGRTIFQALGKPSDNDVYEAVRRHEDHHVRDFVQAFVDTVYWWNLKLDLAEGVLFHGRTAAEAEAALYAAMGGTPDQIADKYTKAAAAAADAFHKTPEGYPIFCDGDTATADAGCATSSIECTQLS